jgi:hypothetical protein
VIDANGSHALYLFPDFFRVLSSTREHWKRRAGCRSNTAPSTILPLAWWRLLVPGRTLIWAAAAMQARGRQSLMARCTQNVSAYLRVAGG